MKKIIVTLFVAFLFTNLISCAPPPQASLPPQATEQVSAPTPKPVDPTVLPTLVPTEKVWEPVTVNMAVQPYLGIGPLFIAIEEGFFEEEGLIIVPQFFIKGSENAAALASGAVDVAIGDINITYFNIMAQNPKIKMVVEKGFADPQAECAYQGMLTRLDTPDYTPGMDLSFLKGQTYDVVPGNQHHFMLDIILKESGFSTSELELMNVDAAVRGDALRSGQVYIVSSGEPFLTRYLSGGGLKVWLGIKDVLPNHTVSTVIFGELFTEKNQEAGVRWMRAYLRAVEQYNQGLTDRNVEILSKYTKLEPDLIKVACFSNLRPSGMINGEGILQYQEWAVEKGLMDAVLPVENFWDDSFLKAAME